MSNVIEVNSKIVLSNNHLSHCHLLYMCMVGRIDDIPGSLKVESYFFFNSKYIILYHMHFGHHVKTISVCSWENALFWKNSALIESWYRAFCFAPMMSIDFGVVTEFQHHWVQRRSNWLSGRWLKRFWNYQLKVWPRDLCGINSDAYWFLGCHHEFEKCKKVKITFNTSRTIVLDLGKQFHLKSSLPIANSKGI